QSPNRQLQEEVNEKLSAKIAQATQELAAVAGQIPPQPGFFSQVLPRVQIPVLVYEQHKLIFWSDHTLPLDLDPRVLRRELQVGENRCGKYLVVRHPPLPTYTLLAVIPLETRYEISNAYLRSGPNPDIFEDHVASIQVEPSPNAIPIFDEQGRHL